jgi:type IV fimbrial biogenesis protein FimT
MNIQPNHKKVAGFTLVELMITLLIAAIVLGLAAPGVSRLLERNRLQTSADSLFTGLMLARSEALKRNQPVTVCKSTNGTECTAGAAWNQGWLVYADADGDAAVDPNEILRVESTMRAGDTLNVAGADFADEISYNTDGSASGTGTFVLCNAKGEAQYGREIQVEVTGRPRLKTSTTDCTP